MKRLLATLQEKAKTSNGAKVNKKHALIAIALLILGIVVFGHIELGQIGGNSTAAGGDANHDNASSQSASVSMSDVAGHWANDSDMVDITLNSSGSCKISYGNNDPSNGTWHLNGTTVIIYGDGGATTLSFTFKDNKLVALNGHTLTR